MTTPSPDRQYGELEVDKVGLTHSFETHSQYCVVTLNPSMNDCQWSEIEKVGGEVLGEFEAAKSPNLIVDLSELEYIGSAMVALIVRIWKLVKEKNARMVVVNRNPMVLEVFKISKLNEVWTIVEYREDALYELGISREAKAETRESNLLVALSLLAAIAAAVAFGVNWSKPGGMAFHPVLQMFGYGCAIVGIIGGMVLAVGGKGGKRAAGVFATVLSIAVAVAAASFLPLPLANPNVNPDASAEESSQAPQPDGSGKTPQPAVAEKTSAPAEP